MNVRLLITIFLFCSFGVTYAEATDMEEDEAGLWMLVDRHEQEIRTSSRLIDDPELRTYLQQMACRVSDRACSEVRVYPLRAPGLNAFMMPNGAMAIQSGLLLRVHDESELAAVIGHEISHYYRRHSIDRLRRWRKTQSGFAVASAIVAAAGNISVNSATTYADASRALELSQTASLMLQTAGIVAAFQLVAYDRNQEKEADLDGIGWLNDANYDKYAASRVWERLIEEQEAGGEEAGFSLLSTHPAPEQRMEYLAEEAERLPSMGSLPAEGGLFSIIEAHRMDWITDELMALRPEQFAAVCKDQVELGVDAGYASYLEAESWIRHSRSVRGRRQKEALEHAILAFERGHSSGNELPAEAFREWARVNLALGAKNAAIDNFTKYVEKSPNAWDRKFVEGQIRKLKSKK